MRRVNVKNISKKFNIGYVKNQGFLARLLSFVWGKENKKEITVLSNISFSANSGEVVGIIGDNGSGKSTLLRVMAGIYGADSGEVEINGKVVSLINLGIGLKERLTMRENIFFTGSILGMGQKEIKDKFDAIVEFSELAEFLDTKIYQFSSGMIQRLLFSVAAHSSPEVLFLDEVFEVGDEHFRRKSEKKMEELISQDVCTILVSHSLELVKKYCNRVIWLEKGKIIKEGDPTEITTLYFNKQS
jgi:ABC-type polysaccharide/polyol phosphate transport system ATPase subunit